MSTDRRGWPVWVRMGLWRIPTRTLAWVYFWTTLAVSVGCLVAGVVVDFSYLLGALLFPPALWYWMSIRWVDANRGWPGSKTEDEIDERW